MGKGKKERYVAFRDENEVINLIDSIAAEKGIDRSDFIREAIRKHLAESFRQAAQKGEGLRKSLHADMKFKQM